MATTLRERILKFLQKKRSMTEAFTSSGTIQDLVSKKTSFMPRTAVRVLQKLAEEGELEVKYEGSKHHAVYRAKLLDEKGCQCGLPLCV